MYICMISSNSKAGYAQLRGFESDEQEQEVWQGLQQKMIPSKFTYVGDAALAYDQLAQQDSYHKIVRPDIRQYQHLQHMISKEEPFAAVIDIGSGNGVNSRLFLEVLLEMKLNPANYVCVDVSTRLATLCVERLAATFPQIQFWQETCDIEQSLVQSVRKYEDQGAVVLTLLGQTIGNVYDVQATLANLYRSSKRGDRFLLGATLQGADFTPQAAVADYETDGFKANILRLLLMAGVDVSRGRIDIFYDHNKQTVVTEFIFVDGQKMTYAGESVTFREGDRVTCYFSRRFRRGQLMEKLQRAGWTVEKEVLDKTGDHALYYCFT
jgi:uncharacterized SAM-dependent methyltransferase